MKTDGKTETVKLKVRPTASNGGGWTTVTASNGAPYSFKYSGGHMDTGGLQTKVGDGPATIAISLDTDDRYAIEAVQFTGQIKSQLRWQGDASEGEITDDNVAEGSAHYGVVVIDTQDGNARFTCDPMISNLPRGGG